MVRDYKIVQRLSRSGEATSVSSRFKVFVELLNTSYGTCLSVPHLTSYSEWKQFCSGLIEGSDHPWRPLLSSLSQRARFSIAHSLFLFRKVIPSEKPDLDAYARKMAQTQVPPDPEFVSFALEMVRKMFPYGWDRSYVDYALSSSLPMTSCMERGRSAGGARGLVAMEREHRSEFFQYVISAVAPRPRGVSRVEAVLTGGKWRVITIPPAVDNALRPLHKTLYSSLSRFDWLLRGKEKPEKFVGFSHVPGEVFVSGDYESATDNLNSDLQLLILSELLERSWTIPLGIRSHALSTFSSLLAVTDGGACLSNARYYRQARGQLMGQLTSFPLLCLINYITFRYSIRRPVPVRINGDDIVFRATPDEFSRWERDVAKGGLTLSRGKTLVHPRMFTLNSSLFRAGSRGARQVGFIRPKALFPGLEDDKGPGEAVAGTVGRFYTCSVGMGRERTRLVRASFLALNRRLLFMSRRSLTRGMGMKVDRGMLEAAGFWHRELFYLEQVVEPALPRFVRGGVPRGWQQVPESWFSKDQLTLLRREWASACSYSAWFDNFSEPGSTELKDLWDRTTPYGLSGLMGPRVRRLLGGMSRKQVWRWVFLRGNPDVFGRMGFGKPRCVWWSPDVCPKPRRVSFVDGRGVSWEFVAGREVDSPVGVARTVVGSGSIPTGVSDAGLGGAGSGPLGEDLPRSTALRPGSNPWLPVDTTHHPSLGVCAGVREDGGKKQSDGNVRRPGGFAPPASLLVGVRVVSQGPPEL